MNFLKERSIVLLICASFTGLMDMPSKLSNILKLALMASILISANSAHAASRYKWIDEAGNVHYSQRPSADQNNEEVITTTEPKAEAEPADTIPLEIPQPADPEAAQKRANRCQELYHDLELYEGDQPIADSEGNPLIVSQEMREAKVTEIKNELDESCR